MKRGRIPEALFCNLMSFKAWCQAMKDVGLLYHFDDDPYDVISSGKRMFTDEEVVYLYDVAVPLIFQVSMDYGFDPFEIVLEIMPPTTLEQLRDKYHERIMKLLDIQVECIRYAGFTCDNPEPVHGDEYRWEYVVNLEALGSHKNVIVTFSILECRVDGSKNGVTFFLDVIDSDSTIIGGMCPMNYTSEVCIPLNDAKGIEERFALFEAAEDDWIAQLIHHHVDLEKMYMHGSAGRWSRE